MALRNDLSFHRFQEVDSDNCGPVCLEMMYNIFHNPRSLQDIQKRFQLGINGNSTFTPQLALDLVEQGLNVRMVGMNTQIIPPAWSNLPVEEIIVNLKAWISKHPKHDWKKHNEYLVEFLQKGGSFTLSMFDETDIKKALDRESVVGVCVDEVWLYGNRIVRHGRDIDNTGETTSGHFVLIVGYDKNMFQIADPFPLEGTDKPSVYLKKEQTVLAAIYSWGGVFMEVSQ